MGVTLQPVGVLMSTSSRLVSCGYFQTSFLNISPWVQLKGNASCGKTFPETLREPGASSGVRAGGQLWARPGGQSRCDAFLGPVMVSVLRKFS